MKHQKTAPVIPKILFWTCFFLVTFTALTITAESLGYKLPLLQAPVRDEPYLYHFDFSDFAATVSSPEPNEFYRNKTENNERRYAKRSPTTHIAFLKVHKAGSTTMQNLFFRFGMRHNLNILLPRNGNYLMRKSQQVPIRAPAHYDIFACHTVYSKELFDSLLPADSVKIGIVREPTDRMISAAYYYRDVWGVGYLKNVPKANFIHALVNYSEKYEMAFFSRTRNSMGKDFGFQNGLKATDTGKIREILDKLNSEFLLVMSTERFDESLVLMRRLLNWSIVDIVYYKTNSHIHSPVVLNKEEKNKFKETSFLDFHIYDYFTQTLNSKLAKQGSDFQEEVNFFQSVLDRVSKFCSDQPKTNETVLFIESSKWDDSFSIATDDCKWMKTGELKFISELRKRQVFT